MGSLVLELQREAMDGTTDISGLLRKATVVARKLRLNDLASWCQSELSGYTAGNTIPEYRFLTGELKVYNPYNRIWMEMQNGRSNFRVPCSQSVAEIQHLCTGGGMLAITAPPSLARRVADPVTPPRIIVQKTGLIGILDAVRNSILEWTLRLEDDGILGEGMTFTVEEKRTAMSNQPTYNIGTFNGVLGNVTSQNAQIGSFGQIEPQLKEAGISERDRTELQQLLESFRDASPAEKQGIAARGYAWITKHAPALGVLANALKLSFDVHNL